MQQFSITLRNEKRRSYGISFLVLAGLNFIAFIFLAFVSHESLTRNKTLFAAGSVAACIGLYFLIKNKKRIYFLYAAILLAAIFFASLRYFVPAFIQVLVLLLFLQAVRELVVTVSGRSISYPSFPRKNFSWDQLNNLLLKDGLLTLDLKNNKLVQQPVDESKTSVNETEFNEFCRKHLQPAFAETD